MPSYFALILFGFSALAAAQSPAPSPDPATVPLSTPGLAPPRASYAVAERTRAEFRPLSGEERLKALGRSLIGPGAIFRSVIPAISEHANNQPPEWGQGTAGYMRRVGSRYGDFAVQNTYYFGAAAALGTEPRYIPCPCRNVLARVGWAAVGALITRRNDGSLTFNAARVSSIYAGAITTNYAWWPDRYDHARAGFNEGTRRLASTGIGNVGLEFLPEIKRILRRK